MNASEDNTETELNTSKKVFQNQQTELEEFLAIETHVKQQKGGKSGEIYLNETKLCTAKVQMDLNDSLTLEEGGEKDRAMGDSQSTGGVRSFREQQSKTTDFSLYLTKDVIWDGNLNLSAPRHSHGSLGCETQQSVPEERKMTNQEIPNRISPAKQLSQRANKCNNMMKQVPSNMKLMKSPTKVLGISPNPLMRPRHGTNSLIEPIERVSPEKKHTDLLSKPITNIEIRLSPSKGRYESKSKLDKTDTRPTKKHTELGKSHQTPSRTAHRQNHSTSSERFPWHNIRSPVKPVQSDGIQELELDYKRAYRLSQFYHEHIREVSYL